MHWRKEQREEEVEVEVGEEKGVRLKKSKLAERQRAGKTIARVKSRSGHARIITMYFLVTESFVQILVETFN